MLPIPPFLYLSYKTKSTFFIVKLFSIDDPTKPKPIIPVNILFI